MTSAAAEECVVAVRRQLECERDRSALADLLNRKHLLSTLLILYERGSASTSELIRLTAAHPASVVRILGILEKESLLERSPGHGRNHQEVRNRLTALGLSLIEAPVCRWDVLLRRWEIVCKKNEGHGPPLPRG